MYQGIKETKLNIGQTSFYKGKVRDVYNINEELLVMVASDRISAFDYVLPRAIPYKGEVLNRIAYNFMKQCEDIVPNWIISSPDPNVTIGKKCEPFKVEMVIRAYLTGHAWREYKSGKRILCGVEMPDGMKESDKFPAPIITPATKAEEGHDMDISREDIIAQGIVSEKHYLLLEKYTRELFERGTQIALSRGLILVDTKYEFGLYNGEITLIDEIHTPDSSRYFYADTYLENQQKGIEQKQLSKEFVRQWLISKGFQGLEGQKMPEMNDDIVNEITDRYIELFNILSEQPFEKNVYENREQLLEKRVKEALKSLGVSVE